MLQGMWDMRLARHTLDAGVCIQLLHETFYLSTLLENHNPSDIAWIGSLQIFF